MATEPVLVQITSAGDDTGPFRVYGSGSNGLFALHNIDYPITKASLLVGETFDVPDGYSSSIIVQSVEGYSYPFCTNSASSSISSTTSTTTVPITPSTTTTTTTVLSSINIIWYYDLYAGGIKVGGAGTFYVTSSSPPTLHVSIPAGYGDEKHQNGHFTVSNPKILKVAWTGSLNIDNVVKIDVFDYNNIKIASASKQGINLSSANTHISCSFIAAGGSPYRIECFCGENTLYAI